MYALCTPNDLSLYTFSIEKFFASSAVGLFCAWTEKNTSSFIPILNSTNTNLSDNFISILNNDIVEDFQDNTTIKNYFNSIVNTYFNIMHQYFITKLK